MPQFMIEKELEIGKVAQLDGSDAHHIVEVLRLGKGDWLVLSDGKGARFKGTIKNAGKKIVEVLIEEKLPDISSSNITLAQAVIKHDGIEAIIQKAVELGVANIAPFTSTRTIPKYSGAQKKIERWNKIALEASKQCGLAVKPKVSPIVTLEELLKNTQGFGHKLMFYEGEEDVTLGNYFACRECCKASGPSVIASAAKRSSVIPAGNSLDRHVGLRPPRDDNKLDHFTHGPRDDNGIIILIGPEGGFAADEVALARKHGFATVRLGPLILRVETAATAAITLVEYFLGHFDS